MKKILILIVLVASWGTMFAQKDTVESGKSVIVKPYQPILQEPNKVNVYPNPETAYVQPPNFLYVPQVKTMQVVPSAGTPVIQTLPKRTTTLPDGGSLVLGYGNFNSPLLGFKYGSSIAGQTDYGLTADHFSLNGKDISRKMGQTGLAVYATRHLERVSVGARLGWEQNTWRYYGAEQYLIDSLGSKGLGIRNNIWRGNAFLNGRYQTARRKGIWGSGLDFYQLNNNLSQSELLIGIHLNGNVDIKRNPLTLALDMNFTNYSDSTVLKRHLIRFEPGYQFGKGALSIYLGLRNMIYSDTPGITNATVLPQVKLNAGLLKNRLQFEAGYKGDVSMVTLEKMRAMNPFLSNRLQMNFTTTNDVYGQLQGLVFQGFSLKAEGHFRRISNQPLFVWNQVGGKRSFDIIYDDMDWYRFALEAQYLQSEGEVRAGVTYNIYQTDNYAYAYQMPALELNLHGAYFITEPLQIQADVIVLGKRFAGVYNNTKSAYDPLAMKAATEVHLKSTYALTSTLNAFIDVNNTLAARYQVWNGYKAAGFQTMAGVRFLF